jgi:hypothetical protein
MHSLNRTSSVKQEEKRLPIEVLSFCPFPAAAGMLKAVCRVRVGPIAIDNVKVLEAPTGELWVALPQIPARKKADGSGSGWKKIASRSSTITCGPSFAMRPSTPTKITSTRRRAAMSKIARKMQKLRKADATARHVRIYRWELESAAYRSLSLFARCLMVELKALYNGTNNGDLYCPCEMRPGSSTPACVRP